MIYIINDMISNQVKSITLLKKDKLPKKKKEFK